MQPLSSRVRAALRLQRFDSKTGKRRRPWAALAGGLAVALFLGSGIAVAATNSAEAHNPFVTANCAGVTVEAEWYNIDNFPTDGNATPNKIVVTIDGTTTTTNFGAAGQRGNGSLTFQFPFADSTTAHQYQVDVIAWDDADFSKGWSKSFPTQTSTPCDPPLVHASATACDTKGGTTDITATFDKLVANRAYTVDVSAGGSSVRNYSITPSQTTATEILRGLPAGATYTITITDSTDRTLTAKTDVVSVGCPVHAEVRVDLQQCIAAGKFGTFTIFANVVSGRDYVLTVYQGNSVVETLTGPLAGPVFTKSYPASPSTSYRFTITDVAAQVTVDSATVNTIPCPDLPGKPKLAVSQCTATSGVSDATLGISVDNLVLGRSYSITVTGGPTAVPAVSLNPATSSTWSLSPAVTLDPGSYTVTVTDVTDPRATGFSSSETAVLIPCPQQQEIALDATTCTVPGGTTDITATVTGFQAGRTYTITLTQNGLPVSGQPVSQEFTPTDATTPYQVTYPGLTAGLPYRVVVTDKLVPSVITAGDFTPSDCPGNPGVVTQAKCVFVGATAVTIGLDKLIAGETYTVSVVATATKQPVAGVADQQVTATAATQSLTFKDLPVGKDYTFTVANATKTLTATGSIFLSLCDFDLPTLAYTGTSTMTPALAGIGFLQFGLVLVGIGLLRRRSGARGA